MNIGFTGSRTAATEQQITWMAETLGDLYVSGAQFHHGDCVGKDKAAHIIAVEIGYWVVVHPPSIHMARAYCQGNEMREPFPYIERNHHIVDETDALMAVPDHPEHLRSGTWATVRYARKLGKKMFVFDSYEGRCSKL